MTAIAQPHLQALECAQAVKVASGRVRKALKGGEITLAEALAHEDAGSLRVDRLLTSVMSERRMLRALDDAQVWTPAGFPHPFKRVRDLTGRQKDALVEASTTPTGRAA